MLFQITKDKLSKTCEGKAMKVYGGYRSEEFGHDTDGGARNAARKSSIGKFPKKSGDFTSHFHNADAKAAMRRNIKRRARAEGKKVVIRSLDEWFT